MTAFLSESRTLKTWLSILVGSVGTTLLGWLFLRMGHVGGAMIAALILGIGPVLGYALVQQNIQESMLSLALGAVGFICGLGMLSAVLWPLLVGLALKRHRVGVLLLWSVAGAVLGGLLVSALLFLTEMGQNPSWWQIGFWLWSTVWSISARLGLAQERKAELSKAIVLPSAVPVVETNAVLKETIYVAEEEISKDNLDIGMDIQGESVVSVPLSAVTESRQLSTTLDKARDKTKSRVENQDETNEQVLIDSKVLTEALINIAVESWRLNKVFQRMLVQIDETKRKRFESRLLWYNQQVTNELDKAGIAIVNVEGKRYDMGMAVTPLNIDEFDDEALMVEQMLQPIVMGSEGLLKMGTVMLKRKE